MDSTSNLESIEDFEQTQSCSWDWQLPYCLLLGKLEKHQCRQEIELLQDSCRSETIQLDFHSLEKHGSELERHSNLASRDHLD